MHIILVGTKPDKADPENVFTANVVANNTAFLKATKAADKPLPDFAYVGDAEAAAATYTQANAHAVTLGFPHLHAYVLHLHATRHDAAAAAKAKASQDKAMVDLCARACVFRLPRHQADQYELSTEAPTQKGGKGKRAVIDGPEHRAFITAQYAEVGVEIVEWLGDKYPKPGLLL